MTDANDSFVTLWTSSFTFHLRIEIRGRSCSKLSQRRLCRKLTMLRTTGGQYACKHVRLMTLTLAQNGRRVTLFGQRFSNSVNLIINFMKCLIDIIFLMYKLLRSLSVRKYYCWRSMVRQKLFLKLIIGLRLMVRDCAYLLNGFYCVLLCKKLSCWFIRL